MERAGARAVLHSRQRPTCAASPELASTTSTSSGGAAPLLTASAASATASSPSPTRACSPDSMLYQLLEPATSTGIKMQCACKRDATNDGSRSA